MKKTRKQYTAEEKVAILRRHLLDQEPISKLCDEVGLQPTVFYRWQKEFFENGAAAFQTKVRTNQQPEQPPGRDLHRTGSQVGSSTPVAANTPAAIGISQARYTDFAG